MSQFLKYLNIFRGFDEKFLNSFISNKQNFVETSARGRASYDRRLAGGPGLASVSLLPLLPAQTSVCLAGQGGGARE
jgi:hypothetical protein